MSSEALLCGTRRPLRVIELLPGNWGGAVSRGKEREEGDMGTYDLRFHAGALAEEDVFVCQVEDGGPEVDLEGALGEGRDV